MIQITKIILTRVEGPPKECVTKHATTLTHANIVLTAWSHSAPKEGGYHQVDFVLHYQDGELYEGRYHLVHWAVEEPDLAQHVHDFVYLHAALWRPPSVPDWQYQGFLDRLSIGAIAAYRHFLNTYVI